MDSQRIALIIRTRIVPVENEVYQKWDFIIEILQKQPMKNGKWKHLQKKNIESKLEVEETYID